MIFNSVSEGPKITEMWTGKLIKIAESDRVFVEVREPVELWPGGSPGIPLGIPKEQVTGNRGHVAHNSTRPVPEARRI